MLSPPDLAVIGVLALIFFGPDRLPQVARKAGQVMREVQNTSHSFLREMERAADDIDARDAAHQAEKTYAASSVAPAASAEGAAAAVRASDSAHVSRAEDDAGLDATFEHEYAMSEAHESGLPPAREPAPHDAHENASGI